MTLVQINLGSADHPCVHLGQVIQPQAKGFYLCEDFSNKNTRIVVHYSQLTPNPMNIKLQHRYRESSFRKYEDILNQVLQKMPLVTVVQPTESLETFAQRFRDAKKSLRENQWTTKIDMTRFFQCVDEITVSIGKGVIYIGSEEMIDREKKTPTQTPGVVKIPDSYTELVVDHPTEEILNALCFLHDQRIILNGSQIIGITQTTADHFQTLYDVAFERRDDGSYTLL